MESPRARRDGKELDDVEVLGHERDFPRALGNPIRTEEVGRGEHRQTLLLVSPERSIVDQLVHRVGDPQCVAPGKAPIVELPLHLADKVLQLDGVLANSRAGMMARHQNGHRRAQVHPGELFQRFAHEGHRALPRFVRRRPRRAPTSSQPRGGWTASGPELGSRIPGLFTICTVLAWGPSSPSDSSILTSVPTARRSKSPCRTLCRWKYISRPSAVFKNPYPSSGNTRTTSARGSCGGFSSPRWRSMSDCSWRRAALKAPITIVRRSSCMSLSSGSRATTIGRRAAALMNRRTRYGLPWRWNFWGRSMATRQPTIFLAYRSSLCASSFTTDSISAKRGTLRNVSSIGRSMLLSSVVGASQRRVPSRP